MSYKIEFPEGYLVANINGTAIKYEMGSDLWVFETDKCSLSLPINKGVNFDSDLAINLSFLVETDYSISMIIIYFNVMEIISMYFKNCEFHLERG
jgi:hypothetical protein